MPRGTKKVSAKKDESKIMKALEAVHASMEDADDVDTWMDEHGIWDDLKIKRLHKLCEQISTRLTAKEASVQAAQDNQMTGSLAELDEYYIFRGAKNTVMLLTPVEVFKCATNYNPKKVIGLIQFKLEGEQYPDTVFAFSGWKPCSEPHERLLDANTWTEKVLEFAQRFEHQLRSDGFDGVHNKPLGQGFASHVEKKLMLFFACRLLGFKLGIAILQVRLGRLWELRDMKKVDVEIFISEEPCKCCRNFQATLEKMTGIKFRLKVCPNLGILHPTRDVNGYKKYPAHASAISSSKDCSESDQPARSRLEVVIRSAPAMSRYPMANTNGVPVKAPAQKPRTPQKRRYETFDDDYTPPSNRNRRSIDSQSLVPSHTTTYQGLLSPFPDEDFVEDSFDVFKAKKIKWH